MRGRPSRARCCSASTAGPGSASVWLHLGALGPRRVAAPEGPTIPAPPYRLVDNDATWLDRADLVFIDPVGTGYSRAAKPELNSKFHSLRGDIDSVGEFIRMYLSRNDRWTSPLYLIGESYGTTRAAGLAGHLVDLGIAFNGVDPGLLRPGLPGLRLQPGQRPAVLERTSPSYAATAWYHKKLPADLQAARAAGGAQGGRAVGRPRVRLDPRPRRPALRRRAPRRPRRDWPGTPGWTPTRSNRATCGSRCPASAAGCSSRRGRSIGRFDSRYQGIETPGLRPTRPSFDPSLAAVRAAYTSTFNQYIRDELGYKTDVPYYILGEGVGRWDSSTEMGYPATTGALRDAMSKNPHMKVLVASGYYDLATPYRAVEHSLAGLGLDPILRKNLSTETYEAGHMMYLHDPSLHKLKRDGAALIDRARGK